MKKQNKLKLMKIEYIRFAPEFEFELPKSENSEELINKGRTLKGWEIKMDGTLNNGIELSPRNSNKLYWNKDSWMQIKEILALVRTHRGFADKKTCGFHVHVDAKKLTDKQIVSIIKEWVHKQDYIVKRFKVSNYRLKKTCQLLLKSKINKLTEKDIKNFRNQDEFNWVNYPELAEKHKSLNVSHLPLYDYQTLEFRLFGASLKLKEIKERILFCLNFIKDSCERD